MFQPLNFLSLNARSLLNKLDELRVIICNIQPDIVCITESWCRPHESDSMYDIQGYNIIRCDRQNQRGGGVLLYVHESIKFNLLQSTNTNHIEAIWITASLHSQTVAIAAVYRPPRGEIQEFCHSLDASLHLARQKSDNTLILGDFNAKNSLWLHSDSTDRYGEGMQYFIAMNNLTQLVDFPTHLVGNQLSSCLDLVITSFDPNDTSVTTLPPLGQADHLIISGQVLSLVTTADKAAKCSSFSSYPSPRWSWNEGNIAALKSSLARKLQPYTEEYVISRNMNDLWQEWRTTVLNEATHFCCKPPCSQPKRPTWPARPWMTSQLTNEINKKHKLYRVYLKTRTPENWCTYTMQRNRVTALLREAKSAFVSNFQSTSNSSSSQPISLPKLHTLMRCFNKQRRRDMPDLQQEQVVLSSPQAKATALNSFFVSQSQKSVEEADSNAIPPIQHPAVTDRGLSQFCTSADQVAVLLKALDTTKSAGHDGVPTRLLKEAADCLAPSLSVLFNKSFRYSELPQDWKDATITPAFKKGDPTQLTNYRPISLLSVISKVQERIVFDQLSTHLNPHLPIHQSGFRANDGTELQLARLVHQISAARDSGQTVLSCFFDLSKAFDRVWHQGLLAKLAHLGVSGKAHDWFSAYLSHRRQRVKVENEYSEWLTIPAGVPQGSVLGPLLFLAYTVDLPSACANPTTICSQFADDTALITASASLCAAERDLQSAVTSAGEWLKAWHLLVNPSKTVVMVFHHPNRPPPRQPSIVLHGTTLSVVSQHKHLGLIIESSLRWNRYVDHILAKSLHRLFQIHRIRSSLNSFALCFLYKTYVRPIIEYASLAYCNIPVALSDKLERFQRKAARVCLRIPLFKPVHHSHLLHSLDLPTLFSRRQIKLALLGHGIYHQYSPPHILDIPLPVHSGLSYSLRRMRVFSLPTTRTDRHRDSPVNASLHLYNSLPADIRDLPAKSLFKSKVESLLLSSICCCSSHPVLH